MGKTQDENSHYLVGILMSWMSIIFFKLGIKNPQETSLACKTLRKYFIKWILTSDLKIALTLNFTK